MNCNVRLRIWFGCIFPGHTRKKLMLLSQCLCCYYWWWQWRRRTRSHVVEYATISWQAVVVVYHGIGGRANKSVRAHFSHSCHVHSCWCVGLKENECQLKWLTCCWRLIVWSGQRECIIFMGSGRCRRNDSSRFSTYASLNSMARVPKWMQNVCEW